MKELHYKRMDKKPKATQEGSLVETNLPVGKSTRLLTFFRKTDPSLLRKLEPIPESNLRAWIDRGEVETEGREDEGIESIVSVSTPPVPALEDRLASKSLDLTSEPIFSLFRTPRTDSNQPKD